jgi:hypothetical protein
VIDSANKAIRFPKQCYVGKIIRTEDEVPLAFMTEDGTDKAAMKRKETVDSWVKRNKNSHTEVLDNIPLVGFRLGRSIKRSRNWGGGNVKWRIEDPRGFELEITSPNMANILASAVIDNGEILNECIWARLQGDNVLLPTSSELYITAQENSERQTKSVAPSSVKRGWRIVLKNGITGIYCGTFYQIEYGKREGEGRYGYCDSSKKVHVILTDEGVIYDYASLKPAEVLETNEISEVEAETLVNDAGKKRGMRPFFVNKVSLGELHVQPTTFDDLRSDSYIAEINGVWAMFSLYRYDPTAASRYGIVLYHIDKEALDNGKLRYKTIGHVGNMATHRDTTTDFTKVNLFEAVYKIQSVTGEFVLRAK